LRVQAGHRGQGVLIGAPACLAFSCTEAFSDPLLDSITDLANKWSGPACFVLAIALAFAIIRIGLLTRAERAVRLRMVELESALNELEAATRAESHILLTWKGLDHMPDRMTGSMHGAVNVPDNIRGIMNFKLWLEPDSVDMLQSGLDGLRRSGTAFNIGVRTIRGELLEADGRAAGQLAALRFRPLAGERRNVSELAYDARKLAKQVERLSAILDSAPFPVWIRNDEGKLQWVNQAYMKVADLPDVDTVLQANFELVKPDALDRTAANAEQSLVGRAHTILRGNVRVLDVYERGLEAGHAGYAVDVTSVEETEKELERHIRAHAATLDKIDTAIAIFGPDQRLRFYNNAYVSLWSFDQAWLDTHPADSEILDNLRTRRFLPEEVNFREWKQRQLSGYTKLEPREDFWYLPDGRSLRVFCDQHPFGGVTYLYENLTKELQLESRYNELSGVQRETLDNLAEAVSLFGSDGRLRLCNPAFAKFWEMPQEIAMSENAELPSIDELARSKKLDADAASAWQAIRFSITNLDVNRKPLENVFAQGGSTYRYRSVPLPDGNSLLTLTDVSDAARAEQALRDRTEALEAADRLKNSILANVSYEIRTPLTSIVGFAEALEVGLAGPLTAKQHEYVIDIKHSSDDLTAIIDAIIDLSTVDAGAMELKLRSVDVAGVVEIAAEKYAALLEKRKVDLAPIEIASDVTEIIADPARVEQVIGHLLSNAIGFSPEGAKVQIGARRRNDMVQIWVADSGRGMEPDLQARAFERFQAKPLPGAHRGAGLGLALVKAFTELHGGRVSLASKLDHGTTVVCSFPIAGPRKAAKDSARTIESPSQAA
jgi:signal transduction histidine kinase